jgi:hypothetical protein
MVFFHEVGHVVCGHMALSSPAHVEEYEAEQFALFAARMEGIAVSQQWIDDARVNVQTKIQEDQNERIPIRHHVLYWALPLLIP